MKHFFKLTCTAAILTAGTITLSSFNTNEKAATNVDAYSIQLLSSTSDESRGAFEWTWVLTNPNPGDGQNGTLQDVSHFSIALNAAAEAALVSAEYSFDGITWISIPIQLERDPAIRLCTSNDVLKFDAGTVGGEPTYYRAIFNQEFSANPYATSWIKSGARTGCNMTFFTGVGASSNN
ncbi:MAG TPA: hypothetical protein VFH08_04720 [Chitinophagaceae bacterium]|nr:hypothetical protein [Chitinophagaceae bacterium]